MFLHSLSQHKIGWFITQRKAYTNPHFAFSLSISFLSPSSLGSGPTCALPSVRPDVMHRQTRTVVSHTIGSSTNSAWVSHKLRLKQFFWNLNHTKVLGWLHIYTIRAPSLLPNQETSLLEQELIGTKQCKFILHTQAPNMGPFFQWGIIIINHVCSIIPMYQNSTHFRMLKWSVLLNISAAMCDQWTHLVLPLRPSAPQSEFSVCLKVWKRQQYNGIHVTAEAGSRFHSLTAFREVLTCSPNAFASAYLKKD